MGKNEMPPNTMGVELVNGLVRIRTSAGTTIDLAKPQARELIKALIAMVGN